MKSMATISPNVFQFPQSGSDDSLLSAYCKHGVSTITELPPTPPSHWYDPMFASVFSPALPPFFDAKDFEQSPSFTDLKSTFASSMEKLAEKKSKHYLEVIDGVPASQWKSMTDNERDDFLKTQRRQEVYKTAICQAFKRSGVCKYGAACRFAHGYGELRTPKYGHPKYKTVLCRNFAVSGICPYGARCQFIHKKFAGPIPQQYKQLMSTLSPKNSEKKRQRDDGSLNAKMGTRSIVLNDLILKAFDNVHIGEGISYGAHPLVSA